MEVTQGSRLGSEKVGRLLFRLALPAIVAQIVNVLYNIVDRMYIGHMAANGAEALTGLGVAFPILMVVSAFASLVSSGGATRAAIMMGKQDRASAEKILGNCATVLAVLGALLTAAIWLFGEKLLMLFGGSPATIGFATDYLMVYAVGTVFVLLSLGLNLFISTQGFARESMLTVVIGAIANIILDPIFIFAFGMGVKGAAWATVISQGISAAWVLRFLLGGKTGLRIHRSNLRVDRATLLPCVALGFSPFIMQSTESVLAVCFNTSLQKYGGDLAVGAMTILGSVMQFWVLPLHGLAQGAQPIISFNYGAGNASRVKKAFGLLFRSSVIYSSAMWAGVMLFPQLFTGMFTSNPGLTSMTVHAARIYMGVSLLMGVQMSCQNTFLALGKAKESIFLALLRKIILLIPLIFILPLFMRNKVDAVFMAEPIADAIAMTVTAILFGVQFRKVMKKMEGEPAAAA